MAIVSAFSAWPSVACACGGTMRHIKTIRRHNREELEFACPGCGCHHLVTSSGMAWGSPTLGTFRPPVPCPCGGAQAVALSVDRVKGYVTAACDQCGDQFFVSLQLLQQQGLWTPEPPKPLAPEPEQTIHGSVIGYRAWRIVDWQLYGTGVNRAWVPGVNEATCDGGTPNSNMFRIGPPPHRHPAPAIGCHCGITALARFTASDPQHWPEDRVLGAIEAWSDETAGPLPGEVAEATGVETNLPPQEPGRFILHGTGFRAQFGKIVLLAIDPDWPSAKRAAVRALAAEHEADVCRPPHLEDAAKEHGQLVPDELLAWAGEADADAAEAIAGAYFVPAFVVGSYHSFSSWSPAIAGGLPRPPRPSRRGKPGISQTLGYPGPPADPTSKFSKGQRVKDSKGVVWCCSKGGKPGLWEREA